MPSPFRRPRVLVALAVTAAVTPALASATTGAAHAGPRVYNYVALGDSYTSSAGFTGAPDTTYVPAGCGQSQTDYPHQVAAQLAAGGRLGTFADASCGGATSANFAGSQSTDVGTNPPQFDRISSATNLVTIGIGGNDIGLVGLASECLADGVLLVQSCKANHVKNGVDDVSTIIAATEPKIEAAITTARQLAAPGARILLVNYLEAVPDNGQGCYPAVPVQPSDMAWFTLKYKEMNAMLATAAANTGAQLVDTYTPTIGHNACMPPTVRYVEAEGVISINPTVNIAAPLHPNVAGANAQSAIVGAAVTLR